MIHHLLSDLPESLPRFDTAFINLSDKEAIRLILSNCGEDCLLIAKSNGKRMVKPLTRILRKFKHIESTPVVQDVYHTGEFFMIFSRGSFNLPLAPRVAYIGKSCLYAAHYAVGTTVDLNCFGINFHKRLKQTDRSNSLVAGEQ